MTTHTHTHKFEAFVAALAAASGHRALKRLARKAAPAFRSAAEAQCAASDDAACVEGTCLCVSHDGAPLARYAAQCAGLPTAQMMGVVRAYARAYGPV